MKCVVLVPGVMGTSLVDQQNRRVWPPSVGDIVMGFDDLDALMSDEVIADEIISTVHFYAIYKTLLNDIRRCGYTEGGDDRRFLPHPYDWRRSNQLAAESLAERLDETFTLDGFDELILVGHSMGGLVLRFLLESGEYDTRAWFDKITTLITLGTPHFGAPKAVAFLTGKESMLGLRGEDLQKVSLDERFPSIYELVGPQSAAYTFPIRQRGSMPQAVEPFNDAIQSGLGLSTANVATARAFWSSLSLDAQPSGVQYFFFGGAAHKTICRNEWGPGGMQRIDRKESGDGTVPVSSSITPSIPHGYARKKHSKIFEDRDLRRALYDFLDAPVGVHPQAADAGNDVGNDEAFGISTDSDTYVQGEPIEIVTSYNSEVVDPIESFQVLAIDSSTGEVDASVLPIPVSVQFTGVELTSFSMTITPELEPGLYELRSTRPTDDPEPTLFVITRATTTNG